jgi:hypothetical protein
MFDKEKLKPFAFGAAALGLVWMAFGLKSQSNYLDRANLQIDSARVLLQGIKTDIGEAKTDVLATRQCLSDIRTAANIAKNDLVNLQRERDNIYKSIDVTIDNSRKKLKDHQSSIESILNRQKRMLDSLNAIQIKDIIIESSKTMNQ